MGALSQSSGGEKESKRKRERKRKKSKKSIYVPVFEAFPRTKQNINYTNLHFSQAPLQTLFPLMLQQSGKQVWLILFSTDKEIE